jgi:hypothetical protein
MIPIDDQTEFLTAATPPTGRFLLVNGLHAWIETSVGSFALSTQRYAPDVLHPDGVAHIISFAGKPGRVEPTACRRRAPRHAGQNSCHGDRLIPS